MSLMTPPQSEVYKGRRANLSSSKRKLTLNPGTVAGKRSKTSKSKSVTVHKKQKGTKGDTGKEQTYFTASDGTRQKKTLANVYKILSANKCSNYYEFNYVNSMYNPNGGAALMQTTATSTAGGSMPVHLIDLSAVPNVTVGGTPVDGRSPVGTSVNQMAPYYTYLTVANTTQTANVYFNSIGPTYPYQLVGSENSAGNFSSYPMGGDQWIWSQIKLNLYGAKTLPLTYKVYLVQFKKDYLHPDQAYGAGGITGTPDEIAERNAFWQAVTKPLMYNPILPQDNRHWKDVKIIKQDTFHIDPKLTTEADVVPHVKTVSYFERMNTSCDYNWAHEATVSLDPSNTVQTSLGENETTLTLKKRVYMLITCECFTPGAFSVNVNGSYDIMVKTKHDRSV